MKANTVLVFLGNWFSLESPHEHHSEVTQQLLQTTSLRNIECEITLLLKWKVLPFFVQKKDFISAGRAN